MMRELRKIILPANRKPMQWVVNDLVMCMRCFYQWTAVYPRGTDDLSLECPQCGCRNSANKSKENTRGKINGKFRGII